MDCTTSTYNNREMENTTSNGKSMDDTTWTSICDSDLWKWYDTFTTYNVVIEEMTAIGYTACESQNNDSRFQCKFDDNLNCMCHELNTIADSNQPQKGVSMNKNGEVDQGQLITDLKTAFMGVETIAFSSI